MSDEEAASSGDKEPPRQANVARRVASAVSGSLSGTFIGSLVQVCALPVRGNAEMIPFRSRFRTLHIESVFVLHGMCGVWPIESPI